ncbi:MAG: hypothetical protein QOD77_1904 [Thermoplasmata archaeon]|jgi:hypothetical protein|nr:hypothetical protein [Thermoplasmata archaeon]
MRGLAVLALLAVLVLVPAAAADLQVSVGLDADVVRPGLTSANATVTVSLDCPQVLARTAAGRLAEHVEIQVERNGDAPVTWSGPEAILVEVAPCLEPTTERSSASIVYLASLQGSGFEALTPQDSRVVASIPEFAAAAAPAEEAEANFTLKAAAVPFLQVSAPQPVIGMEGPTAKVPLRFTNVGNVAVRLEAKATPRNATVGGTLTMPAVELARGASQDVEATFEAPAGIWTSQVMALEVTPVAKGSTERGPTLRIEVLFKAPEVDETAPLPAAGLLALTLLAAAAFAHRRT